MNLLNSKCEECEDGYYLLEDGLQCLEAKYCLEFKNGCLKCSEGAFLKEGKCVKLAHCKKQYSEDCFECASGYFIS